MKLTLGVTAVASAVLLTGCGGSATVDNTKATEQTSIAPLQRSAAPSAAASAENAAGIDSKQEVTDKDAQKSEVSAKPAPTDKAEQKYLQAVKEAGINIEGVEDQLIGAAQAECNDQDHVTVPAVAGQLIEQSRTTLAHGEVVRVIADSARADFCQ